MKIFVLGDPIVKHLFTAHMITFLSKKGQKKILPLIS